MRLLCASLLKTYLRDCFFLCVSCRKHLSYDVTIVTFRYKQYKLSLAFITAFSINSIKHVLEMFSLFLCLHEARLPDWGNMLSTCPSVRPSVRPFVCYQTCERDIIENEWTDFDTNWHKWCTGNGMKRSTLGTSRSKFKVTRAEDMFGGLAGGIFLDPLGSSSFCFFPSNYCRP